MTEQVQGQPAASEATADTQVEAKSEAGEASPERTYTHSEYQAALNKVGSKEKKEGRTARDNELLERSGADSIDDLLAAYTSQQEIASELEGQEVSDLKKQHKADLKAKDSEVEALHKHYALRDALRDAGINAERIPLALKVADLDSLSVKGGSVEGLEAVVEGVKESSPEWFAEQKPRSVGRGSSPGASSGSAAKADVTPGIGRLRVAYETR